MRLGTWACTDRPNVNGHDRNYDHESDHDLEQGKAHVIGGPTASEAKSDKTTL